MISQPAYRSFREKAVQHPDFKQIPAAAMQTEIPTAVARALPQMDNGHEVVMHLAKNPQLCQELVRMSPEAAIARVGRISAQLEGRNGNGNARKDSMAPAPINRPSGGGSTRTSVDPGDMDYQDFKQWRESNRRRR